MTLTEIVMALLGLAGIAVAATSIIAAVASRGTRHDLQNGIASTLSRLETGQVNQDARLERVESKQDRVNARLADHIDLADQRFRRLEGRS